MARHTLRGSIEEGTTKRLIVDDGMLNHGHKIVSFVVAATPDATGNDCWATLSLDYDAPLDWDWGDNRQIAWASNEVGVNSNQPGFSVIDPEHVVIMDLYLQARHGSSGGTGRINYLIELEPIHLTDEQTVMALIKERSQDDLR